MSFVVPTALLLVPAVRGLIRADAIPVGSSGSTAPSDAVIRERACPQES